MLAAEQQIGHHPCLLVAAALKRRLRRGVTHSTDKKKHHEKQEPSHLAKACHAPRRRGMTVSVTPLTDLKIGDYRIVRFRGP
jgi:hypothetical protein